MAEPRETEAATAATAAPAPGPAPEPHETAPAPVPALDIAPDVPTSSAPDVASPVADVASECASGAKREAEEAPSDAQGGAAKRDAKRARSSRGRDSRLNRHRGGRSGSRGRPEKPEADGAGDDAGDEEHGTDDKKDTRKDKNQGRNFRTDRGGRTEPVGEEGDKEARLPKRKVAVLFGYCGQGYSGLQVNPGVKTIEGDVFDRFCTLGAISAANAVNPTKVNLQRSARTDRGVHAAGNLISIKLITESPEYKDERELVHKANEGLPEFIRIWGITRVQNSFDARISCDSRMYEYLLPTYVFVPPKPGSGMYNMAERMRTEGGDVAVGAPGWDTVLNHAFWAEQGTEHTFSEDTEQKKRWRLPDEQLARIRATFEQFSGSHNFHNFTVEKAFTDRSSQRFMKKLTVSDPMEINGTEWLSIKLHGQSFMLHQIRKMIGILILVCRMNVPPSFILETFGPSKIHTPKAPALGLLLEHPLFQGYNRRITSTNQQIAKKKRATESQEIGEETKAERLKQLNNGLRDTIGFEPYEADMETFKKRFVYDHIFQTEQKENEFGKWLNYVDVYQGHDFEYLNPKGVIPQASILRLGEYRRPDTIPKGSKTEADAGANVDANANADAQPESEDENAGGDDVDES